MKCTTPEFLVCRGVSTPVTIPIEIIQWGKPRRGIVVKISEMTTPSRRRVCIVHAETDVVDVPAFPLAGNSRIDGTSLPFSATSKTAPDFSRDLCLTFCYVSRSLSFFFLSDPVFPSSRFVHERLMKTEHVYYVAARGRTTYISVLFL